MRALRIIAAILAAGLWSGTASAQPAKSIKEQIVGTWNLVIAEITAPDGKKILPFGPSPKGHIVFTPDGYFSQVHVPSRLPKMAGNNRRSASGVSGEAIAQGTLSLFGTYSVDEEMKTVTFNIVASAYPNAQETSLTHTIDKLTADEFVDTNRGAARDGQAMANYYRRAK